MATDVFGLMAAELVPVHTDTVLLVTSVMVYATPLTVKSVAHALSVRINSEDKSKSFFISKSYYW